MVDINLIPREYRERRERFKSIFSKTGGAILGLVILSLLFSGGLFLYQSNLKKNLESIKNEIIALGNSRNPETEKTIVDVDKRINLLKNLFKSHFYWSGLFERVEDLTIPEAYFSKAKFTFSLGKVEASLEGNTTTYTNLARQIVSFQEEPLVEKVQVSGISLTEKGVEFTLSVILSEDVLLKK
jgi:hypothetical protein